jgi:hypothetical protein
MRTLILAAILLCAGAAEADPQDKVAARALFDEGRRLLKEGKVDEACGRFEASRAIEPLLGTQLNLAECHRLQGRTATAWEELREAEAMAARAHDDRQEFAQGRRAELEKVLARLTIRLSPEADLAGLEIKQDGSPVRRTVVGIAVPVDPGRHVIAASAPGRTPWTYTVDVSPSTALTVDVPVLREPVPVPRENVAKPAAPRRAQVTVPPPARVTVPPPAPPIHEEASTPGKSRRTLGLVIGGVGVAGIAVGLALGAKAKASWDDAQAGHCDPSGRCDPVGLDELSSAHTSATVSTIAVGVGAAAVVGGLVMFLTAPQATPRAHVQVAPAIGAGYVGATVGMEL